MELDPDAFYLKRRGDGYAARSEYDPSIADYRHAIELNPDDLWAHLALFWATRNAGRRDEARVALEELEVRAASWVDEFGLANYHYEIAQVYSMLGEHHRAIAEAEHAIELRPDRVRGYGRLASLRRNAKGQAAIGEDCDRLAALELDVPGDFFDRAEAMAQTCARIEQAFDDFARAIELAPTWSEPYRQRAAWYWTEQRFDEALAGYEKVIELGAEGQNLRDAQAIALQRLGRHDEADRGARSIHRRASQG